jgi:hypothetical protein
MPDLIRHPPSFSISSMSSPFPPSPPRQLDELQAYDAMVAFMDAYWKRGLKEPTISLSCSVQWSGTSGPTACRPILPFGLIGKRL